MAAMRLRTVVNTVFLLGCAAAAGARDNPLLSVRVLEKLDPAGFQLQCPAEKGVWNEVKLSRGQLWVNGKAVRRASWGSPDSTFKIRVEDLTRTYPGSLDVSVDAGKKEPKFFLVNKVFLEDYAACVTAFESSYDKSRPEYLKALGAVVRLYALCHRERHPVYDLCDLSHCQVYQGLPPDAPFWKEKTSAARDYVSEKLRHADSYYFSRCCGGVLESPKDIWGTASRTIGRVGPDQWKGETLCKADRFFTWTTSAGTEQVESVLRRLRSIPAGWRLKAFEVDKRTPGLRVKTFRARFGSSGGEVKELHANAQRFISAFGKRFGWRVFHSAKFEIQKEGDLYRFSGRGFGHGTGLCQSGALRLAELGWKWREILDFYFPN